MIHTRPIVNTRPLPLAHGLQLPRLRLPRLRTLLTVAFILGGLSMPGLMFFEVIPVNFLLGFIGLALTATGGVMALIFCGEI
jgi:hypothetical protein